jgi:hypothetical protein
VLIEPDDQKDMVDLEITLAPILRQVIFVVECNEATPVGGVPPDSGPNIH